MSSFGFTGTRQGMTPQQKRSVREILGSASTFHHGDCLGSDEQAHDIAKSIGLSVVIHPPSNDSMRAWCDGDESFPEKDYLTRNKDIVDFSSYLIAAPAEEKGEKLRSGTWSTVRYARKVGKKVFVVRPSGAIENQ